MSPINFSCRTALKLVSYGTLLKSPGLLDSGSLDKKGLAGVTLSRPGLG